MPKSIRFFAIALALSGGVYVSGASAAEFRSTQPVAGRATSENIVVALAMKPAALATASDVIAVQGKKKFKKGGGVNRGPGINRGRGGRVGGRGGRRGGRNAAAAVGIGALFLGAVIANEAARADAARTCTRWDNLCARGRGWACRRFEENCL